MSSVARCYTPLKTNIYIKPKDQYEIRRDSFELGVFDASNYYSSIMESTLVNNNGAECAQDVGIDDHSMKKHSINVVPSLDHEEPNKKNKHKKLKPSSPGAKLANYLHSLLNQTLVSKPKMNKPVLFEDDRKSSRTSSMRLAHCGDRAEVASVRSCPSYTRRPPTTPVSSAQGRMVHFKHGYKDLRSNSSCSSKQSDLIDVETVMTDGTSWPALTWFDQELKIRKEFSLSYNVKGLKKVKEEDCYESDSSSDLFELMNSDSKVQGGLGELAVLKITKSNIKPRK